MCKSIIGDDNALAEHHLTRSLSMTSSSIVVIKSEAGIELGTATVTEQDWMTAGVNRTSGRGRPLRWFNQIATANMPLVDLKRRLEGGNDGVKLTISIQFDISNGESLFIDIHHPNEPSS